MTSRTRRFPTCVLILYRLSICDDRVRQPEETLDIDEDVFFQITEMDDDDPDCEFSREIVVDYFKQAATTFDELKQALSVLCTLVCTLA
jgi:hypothetical protein